mmetsp:Transcript_11253/g.24267  ORF Transcript_11253/g.24267 Transcript_11253/m.24267 type:complete len:268 (-) Transcript_11253:933-1736(-)
MSLLVSSLTGGSVTGATLLTGCSASFILISSRAFILLLAMAGLGHSFVAASAGPKSLDGGDLLFVEPRLPLMDPFDAAVVATGMATISWLRSHGVRVDSNITVTHVGIVHRQGDRLVVVEALSNGVVATALDDFFAREDSRARFYVGRVRAISETFRHGAARIAVSQIGKPYASHFEQPPASFYCSSLVDYAYGQSTQRPHVFAPADFRLLFVPEPFWKAYYAAMHSALPVNTSGSNPTLLLHSAAVSFSAVSVTTGSVSTRALGDA